MIQISFWAVIAVIGYEALIYAGVPLLALAVLLLAVPALRRGAVARRSAYVLLAVLALLVLSSLPVLTEALEQYRHDLAFGAATHHLTAPQTFDGITFPAGSTVHLGDAGRVQFGNIPTPVRVGGLSIVGDIQFEERDGSHGIASGTLADAADIHGIPCGAGPVVATTTTTRCVLAHTHDFAGHLLAAGQILEIYRSPLDEPAKLNFGTLARPEKLFDVLWPAGTIIGGVSAPPERMADGSGPKDQAVQFCIPSGMTVAIAGARLHGFLAYDVMGDRVLVSPVCNLLPSDRVGDDGYAEVGSLRYGWGERAAADAPWQWTVPMTAGAH